MKDARPTGTENGISPEVRAAARESAEDQRFDAAAVGSAIDATTEERERLTKEAGEIRKRLALQSVTLQSAMENAVADRYRLEREAVDHRSRLDATRAEITRTENALAATRAQRDALEHEAIAQSVAIARALPDLRVAAANCSSARELRETVERDANGVRERAGREIAQLEATLQAAFSDRARLDRTAADTRDRLVSGGHRLAAVEGAKADAEAELEQLRQVSAELARLGMTLAAPLSITRDDADPTRAAAQAAAAEGDRARQDAAEIAGSMLRQINQLEVAVTNATVQRELLDRRLVEDREQLTHASTQLADVDGRIAAAIADRGGAERRRADEERRVDAEVAKADAALVSATAEVARLREAAARERERLDGIHAAIDRVDDAIQTAFDERERLAGEHAAWRERIDGVSAEITRVEAALREAAGQHERLKRFGREIEHVAGPQPEPAIETVPASLAAASTDGDPDAALLPSAATIPSAPAALTDTGRADPTQRTAEPESPDLLTGPAPAREQDLRAGGGLFRRSRKR